MPRRRAASSSPSVLDPLARRWRKLARRGEFRKAAHAMRELVFRDRRAADWVKLGSLQERAGRYDQALDAYREGAWLFKRAGEPAKAAVVVECIGRLERTVDRHAA